MVDCESNTFCDYRYFMYIKQEHLEKFARVTDEVMRSGWDGCPSCGVGADGSPNVTVVATNLTKLVHINPNRNFFKHVLESAQNETFVKTFADYGFRLVEVTKSTCAVDPQ